MGDCRLRFVHNRSTQKDGKLGEFSTQIICGIPQHLDAAANFATRYWGGFEEFCE